MSEPTYTPTIHQHVESARKCNVALKYQLGEVKMDKDWTLRILDTQERNIAEIKRYLSAQIAEFNDLPPEAVYALDRMIEAEEDAVHPPRSPEDSKVVQVAFGERSIIPLKPNRK